ncbi:MAG: NAD(P)-dependent oxidoreductase [Rickettsiella sp.]|nr:NAD(P)-dependent oxidoreductase [Rickettsiella sp.]
MALNRKKIIPIKSFLSHCFFTNPSVTYLPLLERIVSQTKTTSNLRNTAIVYIHHPLQTSVNLIDCMVRLGAQSKNIFILGKKYSECPSVVQQIKKYGVYYQPCSAQAGWGQFAQSFTRDVNWLWKQVNDHLNVSNIEKVLVLDHGGYATSYIPVQILEQCKVIGVEKTTAGLTKFHDQGLPPFPVIGVANCAVKKILESPLIAEAIVNKLFPLVPQDRTVTCGIIGYGAIGKALATKLLSMNYKVIVYDHHLFSLTTRQKINATGNLTNLIDSSDYIFGCTGQDIIKSIEPFRTVQKDKTLISCSSEDKEFLPLLKAIQKKNNEMVSDPFAEAKYVTDRGATIRILKGGFPINFDNSGESVPKEDIQLTRALVLISILQAEKFFDNNQFLKKAGIYALDPEMQRFVATAWLQDQPENRFSKTIIDSFKCLEWIIKNSGGIKNPCSILDNHTYNFTTPTINLT